MACELGFGQGVSINMHAAASNVQWWGTDFNPSHAGFALELAQASGARAHLFDESFAELCARTDVPQMDYIALHGIWSWISDENRHLIVDFVKRKLKVGGVLYVSYNTQPGWAAMVPMRELFVEHAAVMGVPGQGRVSSVDAALDFASKLVATNPMFARANPQVADRLKKLVAHDRHYLAHEYFNRDWQPMSFASMAHWLEPAKLSFACSANGLDQVDALNLSAEQQALLSAIPDTGFRQTVRDFCVNQGFRKDYWVRGARSITQGEQTEALRARSVVLVANVADVTMKANGVLGEISLHENIYKPILQAMSDNLPISLGEIEKKVQGAGISFSQLLQAVMVLSSKGSVEDAQEAQLIDQARPATSSLNRHLIKKAVLGKEVPFLASPVTGGGVAVNRFQQLFLDSLSRGRKDPAEWAADALAIMSSQGQRLRKEDKVLETPEQNLAELLSLANEFATKRLNVVQKLI